MDIPTEISIKSLLEFSPAYFIQKIWGFRVDGVHSQMLDFLINERRGLLLCPRGHGKSKINQSLISHYSFRMQSFFKCITELYVLFCNDSKNQAANTKVNPCADPT